MAHSWVYRITFITQNWRYLTYGNEKDKASMTHQGGNGSPPHLDLQMQYTVTTIAGEVVGRSLQVECLFGSLSYSDLHLRNNKTI